MGAVEMASLYSGDSGMVWNQSGDDTLSLGDFASATGGGFSGDHPGDGNANPVPMLKQWEKHSATLGKKFLQKTPRGFKRETSKRNKAMERMAKEVTGK